MCWTHGVTGPLGLGASARTTRATRLPQRRGLQRWSDRCRLSARTAARAWWAGQPSSRNRGSWAASCSPMAIGSAAVHDQQEVGDSDLDVALDGGWDLIERVADPELHRPADLARITPDVRAMLVQDRRRRGHLLRAAARRVPHVRVQRGDPQRPLRARAADPDRRVGPLHRLRLGDRVLQLVVLALEGGARLRPQRPDDLHAFLQPVGSLVPRAELQPQHGVLVLRPAGADAELQPPAGQVVDRDGHLRQHRRDGGRCCRRPRTRCGCAWSAAPSRPASSRSRRSGRRPVRPAWRSGPSPSSCRSRPRPPDATGRAAGRWSRSD